MIAEETVMKSITGATTGSRALLAATNGACATIPAGPMTAEPTPVPIVISVAGFAVARKTLPASRDEAAALPVPRSGCSHALSITPPDWNGLVAGQVWAQCLAGLPAEVDHGDPPVFARA